MNSKKDNLLNRFSDLFDNGMGRVQDAADDLQCMLRKDKRMVARKARRRYSEGRDRMLSAEEAVARALRENPSMLAVIALVVVGLIIGRMLMSRRPMLDEEW